MIISIHPSALKHGVHEEDIIYAATWPLWIEPLDEGNPQRELRLALIRQGGCLSWLFLFLIVGMS